MRIPLSSQQLTNGPPYTQHANGITSWKPISEKWCSFTILTRTRNGITSWVPTTPRGCDLADRRWPQGSQGGGCLHLLRGRGRVRDIALVFLFSFPCCIHYLLFLVFRIRLHLFMSLQIRKRRVNGTMRRWARRGCLFAYGIVESPGLYFIRSNYHNLYGID